MIDFTRRKVVKMRKKVAGVSKVICVHISNNSRASMVFFRSVVPLVDSDITAVGDFAINVIVLHKTPL